MSNEHETNAYRAALGSVGGGAGAIVAAVEAASSRREQASRQMDALSAASPDSILACDFQVGDTFIASNWYEVIGTSDKKIMQGEVEIIDRSGDEITCRSKQWTPDDFYTSMKYGDTFKASIKELVDNAPRAKAAEKAREKWREDQRARKQAAQGPTVSEHTVTRVIPARTHSKRTRSNTMADLAPLVVVIFVLAALLIGSPS